MIGKSPLTREKKKEWSILNDVRFVNQIKDLPYLAMLFDFWYSGPEIKIHCEMFCTMWTPVYVCTRPQFERRKKKMSFSCQMYSFRNTLVLEVELSWAEKKESHQTKLSLFLWLASLNPDLWSSFSVTILDFYGPIRNQTIVPSYNPSAHTHIHNIWAAWKSRRLGGMEPRSSRNRCITNDEPRSECSFFPFASAIGSL